MEAVGVVDQVGLFLLVVVEAVGAVAEEDCFGDEGVLGAGVAGGGVWVVVLGALG